MMTTVSKIWPTSLLQAEHTSSLPRGDICQAPLNHGSLLKQRDLSTVVSTPASDTVFLTPRLMNQRDKVTYGTQNLVVKRGRATAGLTFFVWKRDTGTEIWALGWRNFSMLEAQCDMAVAAIHPGSCTLRASFASYDSPYYIPRQDLMLSLDWRARSVDSLSLPPVDWGCGWLITPSQHMLVLRI